MAIAAGLSVVAFGCTSVTTTHTLPSAEVGTPSPSGRTAPLLITGAPFHGGEVGVVYEPVALGASGGTAPYRWSVSVGALPGGLTLSPDGGVSGTPTAGGVFGFSVQVFDADGSTAGEPVSLQIAPSLTAGLISACATACSVEQGCVNVCGTFGAQSGGTAPYTYKVVSGYLPGGMTLDGLSLAGSFPSIAKYWQFTVSVTDAYGITATVTPTFDVFAHISFPGGTVTCAFPGCTKTLPYLGGSGTPTALVAAWTTPTAGCNGGPPCAAPQVPSVSASGGLLTITVAMPVGWSSGYTATMTVALTDQSLCASGTYCSTTGTATVIVQAG